MITGEQLVAFAKSKLGTPYVYGTKGEVLTQSKFNYLQSTYGKDYVWDSDSKKIGKVCCDCSGLISWATGIMSGSSQLYQNAIERHPISTISSAPIGALVWKQGHVGIYIGNGQYIAEDGSQYGCRINKISNSRFTHWLLMSYIDCSKKEETKEVDDEMIREISIVVNGVTKKVDAINKDGYEFIKLRDLSSDKIEIGYDGKNPIVKTK